MPQYPFQHQPDYPFVDSEEEGERAYQEWKKRREMQENRGKRPRTPSEDSEPVNVKRKKQLVRESGRKVRDFLFFLPVVRFFATDLIAFLSVLQSRPLRISDSSTESDDILLLDQRRRQQQDKDRAKAKDKGKGKAPQQQQKRKTTARPSNLPPHRSSKGKNRMLDEREPSVDPESGLYAHSAPKPPKPREGSAESDHAGSLFSGGEDEDSEEAPGPSRTNANAVAGPSTATTTDMPAAHRSRAGRQQEVNRSTIPEHRRRKEFSLVQRIDPPELLAATGAASASASLSSVQDAPPPTEPAIPHAPAVAAPHAVADAGGASNAQVSPSRLPRSIMTIEKGGKLSVVRTKDGHYIEKQRVPSKCSVAQRHGAAQPQPQPRPPRSDSVSVSGSVHASPPPALPSTPAGMASNFGSTDDFGPAAAAEDPQSMDIFDDFVYLSDSPAPAPAHPDSASRRYVLNLPTLATPENIAQPITTSSPKDVHSAFSPPHSSPVKLLYVPTLILLVPHSPELMSGIKPAIRRLLSAQREELQDLSKLG